MKAEVGARNRRCTKGLSLYWKESPKQLFSCKIYEIFKNIYFEEYLWSVYRKAVLKILQNSEENSFVRVSVLVKLQSADL